MANLKVTGNFQLGNSILNDFVIDSKNGSLSYTYGSSSGTGTYYYRKYSSGFIELWVLIPTTVANSTNSAVITFPIVFKTSPYVVITELKNNSTKNDTATNGNAVGEISTTSITLSTYSWNNGRYLYIAG